ncbi:MAG: excinuclease ABC subunit UvrA [Clostridia bacterium]|nr:excinuclease ABC subunit UvrA [Clostridia bacterium]
MKEKEIIIKGARHNNLKNIDLKIPRNKLVVFTGVSGSGKSNLAFDTIYAEGQRRYVESLSSYARMFLGQAKKPDVDSIDGLSPAISIDQKTTNHNPRSTVGTVTEIYDYIRLLYSRIGVVHCPNCHKPIQRQTVDQIVDRIMTLGEGKKIQILSPVVRGQKGAQVKLFDKLRKSGFVRVMVDGNLYMLEEDIVLDKNVRHTISVVVDRIVLKPEIRGRVVESVEMALKESEGLVICAFDETEELFSTNYACPECGYSVEEITPRLFSFNNPYGACPNCDGLGVVSRIDEGKILKNENLSINEGAFAFSGWNPDTSTNAKIIFQNLSKLYGIDLNAPIKTLSRAQIDVLLYGTNDKMNINGRTYIFEGISNNLERRYNETTSVWVKFELGRLFSAHTCPVCGGKRLNQKALSVKIDGNDIAQLCGLTIDTLLNYLQDLKLPEKDTEISDRIIKEINARLSFLVEVGLSYLTLSRTAETLSGGEAQRIRLATQIGSGLMGVLYILDEPSIGLHQRDNEKLLGTLTKLRDLGNSLIVVEHDEDTIRAADHIVDIGPFAGVHGGEIVAQGTVQDIENCARSITGQFLSGKEKIEAPKTRRNPKNFLKITGAKQNNLKNINVEIPLGVFTAVTGVSGSGKSSLINGVLYPYLANELNRSKHELGAFKKITGLEHLDKVIAIDQAPIGKTPRSNPATYTGVFTAIRNLFASTPDAKERGYGPGRFSFNIRGGRCENCEGAGVKQIEMYFMPDMEVPCEVCKGKRYNSETLEVRFKGKNIFEVLDMTIEEALKFFENIPSITQKLQALFDVGLGYMKLGQSATTLSGGEAQRVKLATELAKRSTGKTMYILDEPTTGLHWYDIKKLIGILQRLVDGGNTVLVIEHNLDVIKCADYCIDLGPEGGDGGGTIVATGTPEQIAKVDQSHTGRFLKKILK